MAETTNLKLFKHDNPSTNDAEFDIDNALNENWDKIDETFGNVNDVIVEMQTDVESLKSENDTQNESIEKNTEDISTLKAQKEFLEKEVQSLKEDAKLNGLTEDNSGELIHIDNSTGSRFNALEISGNEKQETREGKNLYNVRDTSGQAFNSSLKVAEDDTISLDNYTNTGTSTKWLDFRTNPEPKLQANKVYYIVTEIFSVSGKGLLGVVTTNADSMGQFAQGVIYRFEALNAGDIKVATATTREDLSACLTETRSYIQMNAGETGSISFRVSVLENSVTAENFKYEKYGESPSFDYPSEIKAVEDNIHLKICNKNFLDVPKNSTVTKAGMTITTDTDGVLTFTGTTTSPIYVGLNKNNLIMQAGNLFERSMFKKGNYNFSVDNLSSTQTLNVGAYIRKNYNSGEIIYLESVFSAKHRNKNFTLEEDKEAVVYLWIASGITLNNAKLKFQIELDNATDIVANEEQNYIVPVQQKMLSGDTFTKVDGSWKEVHTWQEVEFNGEEEWAMNYGTSLFNLSSNNMYNQSSTEHKALCNMAKFENRQAIMADLADKHFAMQVAYNSIFFKDSDFKTVEEFKAKLKELYEAGTPLKVAYKTDTPLILDCTPEQVEILDKIEQEAHTYSEVTNIYTEDEVGVVLKTNTAVDLKTVINNIQEQLIAE